MKAKQTIFPAQRIDEETRSKQHRYVENFVEALPKYIESLQAEGLPTDINNINTYADMDAEAYVSHVKGLFKSYLSRIGICPAKERKRIADNFNELLEHTQDTIAWLHDYKAAGYEFTTDKDGNVIADTTKAHELVDASTATDIDTNGLTEYLEQWRAIAEAWNRLNAYEQAHGLSQSKAGQKIGFTAYFARRQVYGETNPQWLIENIGTEQFNKVFFDAFSRYFDK